MRVLLKYILGCYLIGCCFVNQLSAQTSCAVIDAGPDVMLDCSQPCTDLTATFIGVPNTDTSSYIIGEPACALPPVTGGTMSNLTTDDVWSPVIPIPFDFNFFQNDYNGLVICANGQISFNTALAGTDSGYLIGASELLPTTSGTFTLNTIYGAYHDMNPAQNPDPSQINYFVSGTAPYRTFVINFFEVEHYDCAGLQTTQQIVLYESSNVIEVNLYNKPICGWNGGRATLGIQGNDLTEFAVPPGRNTGVWSAINENYRFVPNGPQDPNTSIVWTDPSGTVVGTGEQINVCPPLGTTVYTATLTFELPDGSTSSVTDDVEVMSTATQITPEFDQIPPICTGDPLGPFPTTSNNGITGNWAPSPDNTTTTEYTFTPNPGQCATTTTMTVVVDENPITPTFTQVPPICQGDPLNPLPTTSIEGVSGSWAPAIDNTTTTEYTFTPDTGQCAIVTTMTIVVNDDPTVPTFMQVPAICNGDPIAPLPTTSIEGVVGSWSPAIDNTNTTVYTFTPNAGQCATTATMTIDVNDPTIPTFTQVPPICTGDPLNPLPTTSLEGITGSWSPAVDNTDTTEYTFTPDADQCATTTTMTIVVNDDPVVPTFMQVPPICKGDPLSPLPTTSIEGVMGTWSPALDNTTTTEYIFSPDGGQCATMASMIITVNEPITPTFDQVSPICAGDPLDPLPTTSLEGITGVWSPVIDNTATTEYTFMPDPDECATTVTMTILVSDPVVPTFVQVPPICEGDPLDPLPTTSLEDIEGTWSPALNNTTTTEYTFTPSDSECATVALMTIQVDAKVIPTFDQIDPICEGDLMDPLPTTSLNEIEGTWSPAINNLETTTYTFTPDPEECAVEVTMTITVMEVPLATAPAEPYVICDNEGPVDDGRAVFDLEDLNDPAVLALREEILSGQIEPDFQLSFYQTRHSAENGTPQISFPYTSRESPQVIFARVENSTTGCSSIVEVILQVNPLPFIALEENYRICVDDMDAIIQEESGGPSPPVLDTGLNEQDYIFVWEMDGTVLSTETGASIIATEIGNYTVTVTDESTGCVHAVETMVELSSPPFTWNAEVTTSPFSNNPMIEAEATGLGVYQFQLDDGPFQEEGLFENVQRGNHLITIRDFNGCGSVSVEVNVIDFPRFITPNEDGYHDTWNISSLSESDPNAKIYIYDRYGKFLTLITPSSNGWDGTFQGTPLPSNDYWFTAEYMQDGEPQVFKGHFSLKR